MSLQGRTALLSLRGMRASNEDAVLETELPQGGHLVVVADGMGGHRSGEVASSMAVEVLGREIRSGRSLEDCVRSANAAVLEEANRNPERAGMGTTLVAVFRSGSAYQVANVGDSRAYRIDRGGIRQLTVDHSFAAEAARAGGMSPEEIARSPWRNALTRSLGTQAELEVDLFGPFEIAGPPHVVLMCTDGVYRVLSDETLWKHLLSASSPAAAIRSLAALAVQNGSDDNVSLAVIDFGALLGPDGSGRGGGDAATDVSPGEGRQDTAWQAPLPPRSGAAALPTREQVTILGLSGLSGSQRRESRGSRSRFARLTSNDSLFLLCAVAIMLWLVLNFSDP